MKVSSLQEGIHAKDELLREKVSGIEMLQAHLAQSKEESGSFRQQLDVSSEKVMLLETSNNDLLSKLSELESVHRALSEKVSEREEKLEHVIHELAASQKQLELQQAILLEGSLMKETLEDSIRRLQQEISELKEVNQSLRDGHQKLLDEILLLKTSNHDLEADLEAAEKESGMLKGKLISSHEDVVAKSNQCNELTLKVSNLEAELDTAQEGHETLKMQLARAEIELMDSARKCYDSERRVQDLELSLSDLLAEKTGLTEQFNEMTQSVHTLKSTVIDLEKGNSALNDEKDLLSQQVSAFRIQEASLLNEMQQHTNTIHDLRTQIEGLKQDVLNSQEAEKRISLEHRKGLDECQSLQWKLQDLREDLNTRQEEKTTYLRDIDVHIGRSNELCSEVRRLESDKDCLQLKLSDLLAERVSLTKQLKERIESVHALEVAVGNSKKEITALEEDKAHLEQQVSTYKLQEACFLDEMQKSSEVLRDLRSEMERVKQELLNAQQNETKLYLQQKKSNDECQSFQQTVKDLQRDLSCCLEEKDLLLKNIESHSAKCNELSSEIKRLEAETDSTKLRLSESLDEKASLMEQLREKTERAQMFEMALVNLKKENATLNEEMGLLQQRTSAFRTEMGLLQQQASVFKTQEASLLAELHESSGIIQDLRSEIEGLKQEQRKSLEQCQSFQQNIKVLQHDLNSCLDEKALLLKTIDNHLANCNELSSEVRRLEAETDRVKLRLSESLDERASLMEQLKEKTECAQMFEMTLLNLKKDNSSLNEKMGLLQQQASAFKTQEASLLTELHESSDIIQGLRSEIEGLQQELLNAQEKEKRISLEQRKSVEECQSLQQNMMDLQRDLSRCLDEKALFVKTIDSHLENCNVLSSEVRRLEAETDCIKLRLSESSDEKASLMEQLKKKTETVQELESALHNLQKENTKLNDEMGLLQQQASAFRIQEASFLAESCKSSDIIQDLRSEMDGLKQELLNARENEKRVLLEKRKCIVECQSFQQVIKDLQCDLNNYAEEKTQFLKSIDSHLARCNELSSEVRRLESETDCLKLRLSELLDEKTLSMEQLREKTETIQDFEIALFNLKKDNATLNEEKGFLQEQVSAFKTQETSLLTELHKSSDIIQDLRSEMEGLRQALLKAQENEKIIFLEQRKSLEECNSFQQTINCLQQDLSICLEEKTSALRDVASHLGRSSELDFEVRRLEADKGTLELKLSEILTEKTSLSEQLTMKVESVNSLETTISDLKKENAILNQELHMLQQKISAFRTQEVSFINEMQRSSGMIHDLKSVMEGLKQEILDAQESEKRVSLEHRKSLDECELLQQTIKDLQRDLDTYNEEKALLLNDVANHSKRSRELDSETRRLETEKSCLQEELFRAQNIEHELRDEVNRLQKEREQLSVACNSLKDVNVKQEKDLQGLHQVIMRSKEEYQFEIHKMSLISEEKTLLLQDLKESQKELNKARGDCFKLQTDLDQLQQAVMIIETDMKKSVDELAVMKEHILVLQHVNADLERELELSTRQAVQKELEGMMLGEILAAAQDENVILEKHLTDMQIRAVENDHKSDKHQKDIEALQEELASAHFSRRELGQRLAHVQIESASSCNKIEEMRKEISELQARNGKLDADLQSVIVEGHENMVKLLSLQEELVCAGRLKLELSAKLSELTDEWDVTERRLQEDILQLKRDVDFHSASASKQENELRLLLEQKEALEAEKASMGKEAFELKQQIAESKSHLAMKDDNLSAKENLLLELQKQVQVYNEKNKDLVESLQELDTELAQSKNLDNMISENLENKCLSYDTTNNQGVSFMSLEASKHDEVSRFGDDHLKIINNVKEKLLILLKENHNAKAVSLTKQQEQISDLQEEILHLNSELKLYKQGVFLLKKIINGEDFQEKAEDKIAHEDAKALQVMLDSLRNTFVTLKLKVNELKEEAERELIQKRQLQAILIHCQTKGVALTSVLKNNFLLFCKGLKTMMSEFNRVACSNDSTFVVIDSLEILSRLEVLCSISDIQDQHNVSEANGTCLESDSQLPNSSSFLLGQLQKRVEESKLFVEAIKVMLPSKDECKDMTTSPINISNQITDSSSVEEMKNSLQHDQHLMLPAEHKESDILSSAEMADYIIKEISEEVRNEERDSIEGASLDQEQERDLIGGLAQLHINLGMRLQQALLDEKLESELQELKEERKKLKDGLDARVQQVQNMEMELEKLHIILKGGKEGIVDPRQQQLHIRHKKKAEKRARRLSSELVIQRQHVGRLQDAVATWTAQQELATEMLEEQVTTLVSNECTPNMDGWDASQVTQLLQEMQSHRALTKRHSMDLESVGHDLERVGSSIESTQRLLMEKVEGRENEDDDEIDRKTFPAKIASGTKSQGKLSRFGLTWLLLFFSTQRALFRRSASSTASVAPPRTAQRNSEVAGNALTSLVPQTRRMSCCACIMSSGRPHHLMALNEK
ncbi:hypothetical protein KP509_09G024700 [Ceratopteris richardii]|nr:hypothetical protein KP509_09G024700 [Ceratopteris richardii]